jgi:hypothetical protein
MNSNWHPQCFRCEECSGELADAGFIKCQGRALCHACNARVKAGVLGKHICHQCQYVLLLWFKNIIGPTDMLNNLIFIISLIF